MGYLYRPKHPPKGIGYTEAKEKGLLRESSVWWAKYYANGRPIRVSTGKEKVTEAREFLKDREGRVAQGQPILPRVDRIRYDEAAKDLRDYYATTGNRSLTEAEFRLTRLDAYFKGWRLVAITPDAVTRYIKQRQEAGAANGTINREVATLGRMLRLAYEHGKLLRLPVIHKLTESPAREGFVTSEQFDAIRRHLPDELRVPMTVAFTLGWRREEVLSRERRRLDLTEGTLRLDPGETKNREGRTVYLPADLELILREQVGRVQALERKLERVIPWLFPHLEGPHAGERITDPRKAWASACKAAGFVKPKLDGEGHPVLDRTGRPIAVAAVLIHDLRRSAVRTMEAGGVPRSVAMRITGHKTEAIYRRYAIVSPADLKDAARKLSAPQRAQEPLGRVVSMEAGPRGITSGIAAVRAR